MVLLYYSAWFIFFYQKVVFTQAMVAFPISRWVALILFWSLLLSCVSLRVPHPCVGNFLK